MRHLFVGVIALCFVAVFILSFLTISRSSKRRVYWSCAGIASAAGFLMTYPTWNDALLLGIAPFAVMTVAAYAYTPYVKIRGKIYALTVDDRRPDAEDFRTAHDGAPDSEAALVKEAADLESDAAPDSYGGSLTPATMWWLLVLLAGIMAGNVYGFLFGSNDAPVAVAMAMFLALLAVGNGYGDASWHYPLARGQYLQFVVIAVISAGTFTLVYLTAYYAARRWPLRRTQSWEYRAHSRHRESP